MSVQYRSATVAGMNVTYREAGNPANPALLLLHGFPASSFMYRHLMRALADRFHLVAPDYPGFGNGARRTGGVEPPRRPRAPPRSGEVLDRLVEREARPVGRRVAAWVRPVPARVHELGRRPSALMLSSATSRCIPRRWRRRATSLRSPSGRRFRTRRPRTSSLLNRT